MKIEHERKKGGKMQLQNSEKSRSNRRQRALFIPPLSAAGAIKTREVEQQSHLRAEYKRRIDPRRRRGKRQNKNRMRLKSILD